MCVVKWDQVWLKKYKMKMPWNTIKCFQFPYKRAEYMGFRASWWY